MDLVVIVVTVGGFNAAFLCHFCLKTPFQDAHLFLDLGQLGLGDRVRAGSEEVAVARGLDTVGAWLDLVTLEFAAAAFQAAFNDAIPTADARF